MAYERKRWIRIVSGCVGATLVAACSTVQLGHDFDIDTFAKKVEQGVTTEADVRAWLGAPTNVGEAVNVRGEHHMEWTYYFAHGRLPSMKNAKFKTLQVRFDSRGTVLTYSWSGEASNAKDR